MNNSATTTAITTIEPTRRRYKANRETALQVTAMVKLEKKKKEVEGVKKGKKKKEVDVKKEKEKERSRRCKKRKEKERSRRCKKEKEKKEVEEKIERIIERH
ncbi:hypothetical protein C2G38_2173369 [Gigaspora rosea]|uniref:Uncharacterized protein n=1 Tax=Gigaspora rosea TaxID=44941 RepID=A0A397VJK9_9GLOM|nr:hypothetical protein C2G38_2173369 [Gigaspora rosea]